MIGKENLQPKLFETVNIENLVPQNHILRKIKQVIDFSYINKISSEYYCSDNGRPSIPPIVLFKFIFIGYLFGIRSERRIFERSKVLGLLDISRVDGRTATEPYCDEGSIPIK